MVADHAPGFLAAFRPDRQRALTENGEMRQHRFYNVIHPAGLGQSQQRAFRAEDVPDGNFGIVVKTLRLMDIPVGTAELAVHVAQKRGRDHRVIKRGVKGLLEVVVRCLDRENAQRFFPLLAGSLGDGIKIPAGNLGDNVGEGGFAACIGDADLQECCGRCFPKVDESFYGVGFQGKFFDGFVAF